MSLIELKNALLFIAAWAVATEAAGLWNAQYNEMMHAHDEVRIFVANAEPGAVAFDAWSNQTLLSSLEQGGIDWPSSCRNGTCRTCIGQLVHGRVRYEIEWPGLSAEEKVAGYTLPCVAYPCSGLALRQGGS